MLVKKHEAHKLMKFITQKTRHEAFYVIFVDDSAGAKNDQVLIFTNLEAAKEARTEFMELAAIYGNEIDAEIKKFQLNLETLDFNEEEKIEMQLLPKK